MHIVLGFLLAAFCIYWWALGSIVIAIAASLPVLFYAVSVHNVPVLVLLAIIWAPYAIWSAVRNPDIFSAGIVKE